MFGVIAQFLVLHPGRVVGRQIVHQDLAGLGQPRQRVSEDLLGDAPVDRHVRLVGTDEMLGFEVRASAEQTRGEQSQDSQDGQDPADPSAPPACDVRCVADRLEPVGIDDTIGQLLVDRGRVGHRQPAGHPGGVLDDLGQVDRLGEIDLRDLHGLGSAQHLRWDSLQRLVVVHHVGHDQGDVVEAATLVCSLGQRADDRVQRLVGGQQLEDDIVIDHSAQPVGAEEHPVAEFGVHQLEIGSVHRLPVEHLEQQRAVRMLGRLVDGDLAAVDQ
ncbi:hypothetical protein SDC9_151307 [bioreactor metagenome]|uniref:Uncharacterized protein n=1 Tax=bioreactor metagenome TaxID=1076179 RepID=A0A645EPW9_9ZZZZ